MAVSKFRTPTRAVSLRMQHVKSKNTSIELKMEKFLKDLGLEYEAQPNLYGHPDFRLSGTKILVFCDGSFWHGRNKTDRSGSSFGRNVEFWKQKINYNFKRDSEINRTLRRAGWVVIRFWDTDISERPEYVKSRIFKEFLHARKS